MRQEVCIKRYIERVGGEWRTTAKDRKNRRLFICKQIPNISDELFFFRSKLMFHIHMCIYIYIYIYMCVCVCVCVWVCVCMYVCMYV